LYCESLLTTGFIVQPLFLVSFIPVLVSSNILVSNLMSLLPHDSINHDVIYGQAQKVLEICILLLNLVIADCKNF